MPELSAGLPSCRLSCSLNGHTRCVDLLLGANAEVDAADEDGQTPLMMAAGWGYAAVVQRLLEAGAD